MEKLIICTLSTILFACASNKINSSSTQVIDMSTDKAPADCKFVGRIYGGHITSANGNTHLIKNVSELHISQAKKLGANYIEMNPSLDGGKAYSCPNSELEKINQHNWNN